MSPSPLGTAARRAYQSERGVLTASLQSWTSHSRHAEVTATGSPSSSFHHHLRQSEPCGVSSSSCHTARAPSELNPAEGWFSRRELTSGTPSLVGTSDMRDTISRGATVLENRKDTACSGVAAQAAPSVQQQLACWSGAVLRMRWSRPLQTAARASISDDALRAASALSGEKQLASWSGAIIQREGGCWSRPLQTAAGASISDAQVAAATASAGPTMRDSPLAHQGPYCAQLVDRGVLRFEGPDTLRYLQGLTSNDMTVFAKGPAPASLPTINAPYSRHSPQYSAVFTPEGRFLFDLFFYAIPGQEPGRLDKTGSGPQTTGSSGPVGLLADVDKETREELLAFLNKHRLRAKVGIQDVTSELSPWAQFAGALAASPAAGAESEAGGVGWQAERDPAAQTAAETDSAGYEWFQDPRLPVLGLRGVFPAGSTPPLVAADNVVDPSLYVRWRYEQGVAEGPVEISSGKALPLEYNLDALHAISFDKGCYVGQELTARTHFRGVIRKRVLPVVFVDEQGKEVERGPSLGAEVMDEKSGRSVGQIRGALGTIGIAHLRLDAALSPDCRLTAQVLVGDASQKVIIQPQRPTWWPSSWGRLTYKPVDLQTG